jgi:hypothetical protein
VTNARATVKMAAVLKKKHIVLHTDAEVDQAQGLLEAQTVKGSAMPDHPLETMKDTFALDKKPFRGEVGAGAFKLTRRRRGRNVRIALEGTLEPKKSGGTEIKASMSAPPTLVASLFVALVMALIAGGGAAAGALPPWAPLLMLLAGGAGVGLASRMYERETSRTFSALRDAIPAHPPQAVAPISDAEAETPVAERNPTRQR